MRALSCLLASLLAFGATGALADSGGAAVEAFWPAEADSNNDDMISRDEAMILSETAFIQYDRDGNGAISLTEWRAAIDDRMASAQAQNPAGDGMIERDEAAGTVQSQKKGD